MNTTRINRAPYRVLGFLLSGATALAAEPATADAFTKALKDGKVSLNVRPRYEVVDQSNRRDADALTIRTALGFTTASYNGFTASIEVEDVTAVDGSDYVVASTLPSQRAAIVDPAGTEVNQVWLAYKFDDTTIKGGRFNLVLDNFRFIGNVGWRQNQQTFDGAVIQDKTFDKLALTYAYLDRINRILGDDNPGGNWTSDSHVLNASYTGLTAGTLTGYAYLLDFDNAAAFSCATYGVSFAGAAKLSDALKLSYRAEYALQSDYGSSTLSYDTDYYVAEAGLVAKPGSLSLGYEVLGSDNNVGFKTPLATLHAFNGWADLFLATPAAGLKDYYVKGTASLPAAINLLAFYHKFEAESGGADFGDEIDVQLTRKFGKYFTGLVKYAKFESDSAAFPDVEKIWVQVEFAY
ncbi:MAG TPA: alginate export family protein [Opitutaceae bacterium]